MGNVAASAHILFWKASYRTSTPLRTVTTFTHAAIGQGNHACIEEEWEMRIEPMMEILGAPMSCS